MIFINIYLFKKYVLMYDLIVSIITYINVSVTTDIFTITNINYAKLDYIDFRNFKIVIASFISDVIRFFFESMC